MLLLQVRAAAVSFCGLLTGLVRAVVARLNRRQPLGAAHAAVDVLLLLLLLPLRLLPVHTAGSSLLFRENRLLQIENKRVELRTAHLFSTRLLQVQGASTERSTPTDKRKDKQTNKM